MKTFYIRVTSVTNLQQIGIVANAEDSHHFLYRIKGVFPSEDFNFDDFHVLAPLEVLVVHPSCKGILVEQAQSMMVDCDRPLLISSNSK